jgi:hypothetical protein
MQQKTNESNASLDDSEDEVNMRQYDDNEIHRMRDLLKIIMNAKIELAKIQNYHESYSIMRICEPAAFLVKNILGEHIDWN